jgi:hypothetical protein
MDDEIDEPKERPIAPAKLSRTPSWIMVGFILGALFVWMLPRDPEPPAVAATTSAPSVRSAAPEPARLTLTTLSRIEAVFEAYSQYAVWDDNLAEVALWSPATNSFSEFYEIKRVGDVLYFRSLTKLTRRLIEPGKTLPAECPLRFTETEAQYRQWRERGRSQRPMEAAPSGSGVPDAATATAARPKPQVTGSPVAVPRVAPPPLEKPGTEPPPKT